MHQDEFTIDWDLDMPVYYLYKIVDGTEYFLKDVFMSGQAIWTSSLHKALEFDDRTDAEQCILTFFPKRKDLLITER